MSKSPPGIKRVVAVLNFFAEHPGQAFTFTDIVKALDLGRATCHSLLGGLVEAQYLYRNIDKSYVVGPALAAIGKLANEQFSPLQATQPELRALSDEFRMVSSAVYREGSDVLIKLRAGSGNHRSWSVPQGRRLPLRAPFAAAFFATAKRYDVEKWLDQLTPIPPEKEKQALFAGIESTRRLGFSFAVHNPGVETSSETPELAFTGAKSEYPVEICSELDKNAGYLLSFLSCPVFNKQGEVEFVLNMSGDVGMVSGAKVEEMGRKLRAAAERVTYFTNGNSEPYPLPV